jgi:hypothetical protein
VTFLANRPRKGDSIIHTMDCSNGAVEEQNEWRATMIILEVDLLYLTCTFTFIFATIPLLFPVQSETVHVHAYGSTYITPIPVLPFV